MPKADPVAEALREIADSIIMLGNAGVSGPNGEMYGGLEGHGMAIIDAASGISEGLHDVASAIRELAEAAAAKP